MRVEPYGVDSVIHVVKRGARGMEIVRDDADKQHFVRALFYLNDTYSDVNWKRDVKGLALFERPDFWPSREPLVHILAWTLLPNHFHLLIQEIKEGGTAKFMQRLCGSMSAYFNAKHNERGSIFQGAYRSRTVSKDTHLRYLAFYIQVKNVLELCPGGLTHAAKHFDDAWNWAMQYRYSSLQTYLNNNPHPTINSPLLEELYSDRGAFKQEAKMLINAHLKHHIEDGRSDILLEPW